MKIALVCSHGGHLTEMLYLLDAFKFGDNDIFFITYDSERTRNLEFRKYLFNNFGEKIINAFASAPRIFKILIKEKPDIMISNGAEIAVPFFYIAKLLRIKTIFIECYTRIEEPTVTGKLVYPISDLFLVLWKEMLSKYGKKAQYQGGLFEIVDRKDSGENIKEDLIFVTVGMHYQGFDRLVKKMDDIAGKTKKRVVMQIGNTQFIPKYAEFFYFKDYKDIMDYIKKAKYVVCQGAMSAVDSITSGTPVIIVPRSKEQNEVINNHQQIFAEKLAKMNLVKLVEDLDELESVISSTNMANTQTIVINRDLVAILRRFVK